MLRRQLLIATLCGSPGVLCGQSVAARDTVRAHQPVVLAGRIVDSVSLAPIRGARVMLRGTQGAVHTDDDGNFSIADVKPGRYLVDVRTSALDSLNAAMLARIEVTDSMAPITIRVPTADPAVAHWVAAAAFAGTVLNDSTKAPIPNAEVSLPALSKLIVTNDRGEFKLTDIAPGPQRVRIRRLGYGLVDTLLDFHANQLLRRTVYLARVTTLDSVFVRAAMRDPGMEDFYENQHVGLGHFVTCDDVAKFESQHLSDVIAQTPGVMFVRGHSGQSWLTSTRRGFLGKDTVMSIDQAAGAKTACYAQVYLDNALMYASKRTGAPSPLFDLNTIPPSSIEAIEYFAGPGEIPAKYLRLNSECGVLVIHTRR